MSICRGKIERFIRARRIGQGDSKGDFCYPAHILGTVAYNAFSADELVGMKNCQLEL